MVDYEFWTDADGSPWLLREIDVREALSGEFVARVEIENDDPLADPAALLGKEAVVTLTRPTPEPLVRRFAGVVRAVDEPLGSDRAGRRRCLITVEPAFACLKEERLTRKFVDQTVPDVVRRVLTEWAVLCERRFELRLGREAEPPSSGRGFAKRDLCVQYDETTFDFLRRILAEEGLTYYFDPPGDGDAGDDARHEKLIVVDDNGGFPEAPEAYPLRPLHGGVTSREAVHALSVARGRSALGAEARAFNLTQHRPIVEQRTRDDGGSGGQAQGDGRGDGELELGGRGVTLYGYEDGAYRRDDAAIQARLAVERSAVAAISGRGSSDVIALCPGLVFELEPAPDEDAPPDAGGKRLVVSVRHRGGNPERLADGSERAHPYTNDFTFVPAAIPFRPALLPKPIAVEDWGEVVSPTDGDPIHTDVHGRVRVRFGYADRTEAAERCSPFIPVSQAWSGDGYGTQIIPRAGMLVRLRYLYGDPDRPLVVGCLPTGRNVLPSPPPEEKTRLTIRTRSLREGGNDREHWNEISLDDAANHEEVFVRAGHDYRQKVLHDESVQIDHDERRSVGHDQTLEVQGARHQTVHQDETIQVMKKRTTAVVGDDERHVQGNDRLTVAQDRTVAVLGKRSTTVHGAESAAYLAGREEAVTGDDKLHVSETLTTIADKVWRASQGPTDLVLEQGNVTLKAGCDITLQIDGGTLRMDAGGTAVLQCNQKISLECGQASIVLSPDKIEIAAPEVQLTGANGSVKLDRSGATTTGLTVSSSAMATNELTGAFVKAN
jgi:type VI secretion system secreted protein VgrG